MGSFEDKEGYLPLTLPYNMKPTVDTTLERNASQISAKQKSLLSDSSKALKKESISELIRAES